MKQMKLDPFSVSPRAVCRDGYLQSEHKQFPDSPVIAETDLSPLLVVCFLAIRPF
jgi:hypothetical protein